MIDQTKPDIVWAFTPTNGHLDVVRYCAPKGIHVIMEKPLAATLSEGPRNSGPGAQVQHPGG